MWGADLSTIALLAAVLWLDGWRRVPDGSIVVRRVLWGPWRLVEPAAHVGSFALLAWWPPFVVPLVLPTRSPATGAFDDAVARVQLARRRLAWASVTTRLVAIVLVVWIVVAIPVFTGRAGTAGLVRGVVSAFVLSSVLAMLTTVALRMSGITWRNSALRALPLVSPFSACRAPELTLDASLGSADQLTALRALLGEEAFLSWLRPYAFDAMRGVDRDSSYAKLPSHVLMQAIAAPREAGSGEAYCERCGRVYRDTARSCSECAGVELRLAPAG